MKTARIALGIVVIGGILAFLLSWMNSGMRYTRDPGTIITNTYDREVPGTTVIPVTVTSTSLAQGEEAMIAFNNI